MKDSKRFVFVTSCVDAPSLYGADAGELINEMQETARDVTFETFARNCADWQTLADSLGYAHNKRNGLTLRADWHVKFRKGRFNGVPCFFLVHSCIEYIFTEDGKTGLEEREARELDEFALAYVTCALWLHDENPGSGQWSRFDEFFPKLAPETLAEMKREAKEFQTQNAEALREAYAIRHYTVANAGHDFWLTRNGHGAGFWDRGSESVWRTLTDAAHVFGSLDLYASDDGKLYLA